MPLVHVVEFVGFVYAAPDVRGTRAALSRSE